MRGTEPGKVDPFLVKLIAVNLAISAVVAAALLAFTTLNVPLSLAFGFIAAAFTNIGLTIYFNGQTARSLREAQMWEARADELRCGRRRDGGAS